MLEAPGASQVTLCRKRSALEAGLQESKLPPKRQKTAEIVAAPNSEEASTCCTMEAHVLSAAAAEMPASMLTQEASEIPAVSEVSTCSIAVSLHGMHGLAPLEIS